MKKNRFLRVNVTLMALMILGLILPIQAEVTPFNFPGTIKYKLLRNDNIVGECYLIYTKETDKAGISSMKLSNFQGMGRTSDEKFLTYFSSESNSLYAEILFKGADPVYEIRLKNGLTFDLKNGQVFVYKEKANPELQTELFTKYPVIDFQSAFFVTSLRVAQGKHKKVGKYNLLFDKSTKISDMVYQGTQKAPYLGQNVPVEVITITINKVEMFCLKIHKDKNGYFFPVSVTISTDDQKFEIRADQIVE